MGYASTRKIIYAQSGALLEQFIEHFFADTASTPSALRLLELPEEKEFGQAILNCAEELKVSAAGKVEVRERSKDAFLLVEFLHNIRTTGPLKGIDPKLVLDKADAYFAVHTATSLRLTADAVSVRMFKKLEKDLRERPHEKFEIFERAEQDLLGPVNSDVR